MNNLVHHVVTASRQELGHICSELLHRTLTAKIFVGAFAPRIYRIDNN